MVEHKCLACEGQYDCVVSCEVFGDCLALCHFLSGSVVKLMLPPSKHRHRMSHLFDILGDWQMVSHVSHWSLFDACRMYFAQTSQITWFSVRIPDTLASEIPTCTAVSMHQVPLHVCSTCSTMQQTSAVSSHSVLIVSPIVKRFAATGCGFLNHSSQSHVYL